MKNGNEFDVIIIGGSYAGLSAALTLGRAITRVLIIDSNNPCNKQTPVSHNFITQDKERTADIITKAKEQVLQYPTIRFEDGKVIALNKTDKLFEVDTAIGERFIAKKVLFSTGIVDIIPEIRGFKECWGISILHCPYCHGYEVKGQKTAIFANGMMAYLLTMLISNWTAEIILLTHGRSMLTQEQTDKIQKHGIEIIEKEIKEIEHREGQLQGLIFQDNSKLAVSVMYTKLPFRQHSDLPAKTGCAMNEQGYIQVAEDGTQKTTVPGIYAAGDNTTIKRAVAVAAAQGAAAGHSISGELIMEVF